MLEVCCGVTNGREKDGGVRALIEQLSKKPRVMGAPLCAKCSDACCSLGSSIVQIVCVV